MEKNHLLKISTFEEREFMNFNFKKKDYYICPYCFSKHDLTEIGFVCENEAEKCENARTRNIIGLNDDDGKGQMPESQICDKCGVRTTTKVCPTCKKNFLIPLEIMII